MTQMSGRHMRRRQSKTKSAKLLISGQHSKEKKERDLDFSFSFPFFGHVFALNKRKKKLTLFFYVLHSYSAKDGKRVCDLDIS